MSRRNVPSEPIPLWICTCGAWRSTPPVGACTMCGQADGWQAGNAPVACMHCPANVLWIDDGTYIAMCPDCWSASIHGILAKALAG